jgi:hypothetical protein
MLKSAQTVAVITAAVGLWAVTASEAASGERCRVVNGTTFCYDEKGKGRVVDPQTTRREKERKERDPNLRKKPPEPRTWAPGDIGGRSQ